MPGRQITGLSPTKEVGATPVTGDSKGFPFATTVVDERNKPSRMRRLVSFCIGKNHGWDIISKHYIVSACAKSGVVETSLASHVWNLQGFVISFS
jgi:hypothetical protein